MLGRCLAVSLLLLVLLPAVEAQSPNVRARVVPQFEEVALEPGQRGRVALDVSLQVTTSCTQGTRFGVTLIFADSFPKWAGASPEPANLQFGHDGGEASAVLEIFPAEDAPPGQSVTYRLRPEVKLPSATNCTGELRVDGPVALVKLTIVGSQSTETETRSGGGSPGVGVWALLVSVLVGLRFRRRA